MKDKHFLFSLSLAIAVAAIMLLSIFVDSSVFDGIAQSITIPFLLFTVVSCVFSIAEEIINICNTKSAIEKEKYDNASEYFQKVLGAQIDNYNVGNIGAASAFNYYSTEYLGVVTQVTSEDVNSILFDCMMLE